MTDSQVATAVNSASSLDPELGIKPDAAADRNKDVTPDSSSGEAATPPKDGPPDQAPGGGSAIHRVDTNASASRPIHRVDTSTSAHDPIHRITTNASSAHENAIHRYISAEEKPRIHSNDPNIIDWDGDDDPENPRNWPWRKKIRNILIVSLMVFVVPLASSMFAPGIDQVMTEFHNSSQTIAAFVVSVFVLGFAFGPLLLAPLSEVYGRLHVYWICDLLFFVFSICCAKAKSMGQLIAFRFLCGFFGGLPLSVGGGTITDVMNQEERGLAMAIFGMGPMMGPVAGPIIGGFLSQAKGWRWVFWLLSILGGVCAIMTFVFMDETYAPVILQKRVNRLRKERNNPDLRSALDDGLSRKTAVWHSLHRPLKLLLFVPAVSGLALFQAFCFGCLYLIFTTFTMVYDEVYHWSIGLQGLAFIPMGSGAIVGTIIFGTSADKILEWKARTKGGGVLKPEYRLYLLVPSAFGIPIGMFWYGWAAQAHTFWLVPILGTFFIGIGFFFSMVTIISYVMDAYTEYSASAVASVAILRSLFGGLLPLAGRQMYVTMGYGWGSSLLGFVSLALTPIPYLFYQKGEYLRTKYPVHLD